MSDKLSSVAGLRRDRSRATDHTNNCCYCYQFDSAEINQEANMTRHIRVG